MARIRPQVVQATEDNLPNAFLQPVWPQDIPCQCPQCGAELRPRINLSYGYGKLGRACLKISHWITLPWAVICFFLGPHLFSLGGNGGGFALGILMLVPGVAFAVAARCCPSTRRVRCYPCKYSKDYPMLAR